MTTHQAQTDHQPSGACRYSVQADACPSVLPNLLALIAKRGIVPDQVDSQREADDIKIAIIVSGLAPMARDHLASCMRQVIGVEVVLCDLADAACGNAAVPA